MQRSDSINLAHVVDHLPPGTILSDRNDSVRWCEGGVKPPHSKARTFGPRRHRNKAAPL